MGFIKRQIGVGMRDVTSLASLSFIGLLLVFLVLIGHFTLFYRILIGFILIYVVAIGIRLVYFKERPNKQKYKHLIEKIEASSFPSVHSMRAVFLAFVLSHFFESALVISFFTIAAAAICYSRIFLKKHDWIDVGAGIVLGVVLGLLVVRFM